MKILSALANLKCGHILNTFGIQQNILQVLYSVCFLSNTQGRPTIEISMELNDCIQKYDTLIFV